MARCETQKRPWDDWALPNNRPKVESTDDQIRHTTPQVSHKRGLDHHQTFSTYPTKRQCTAFQSGDFRQKPDSQCASRQWQPNSYTATTSQAQTYDDCAICATIPCYQAARGQSLGKGVKISIEFQG